MLSRWLDHRISTSSCKDQNKWHFCTSESPAIEASKNGMQLWILIFKPQPDCKIMPLDDVTEVVGIVSKPLNFN